MNSSSYSHSADYSLIQNACGEILLWPKHADLIKLNQVKYQVSDMVDEDSNMMCH